METHCAVRKITKFVFFRKKRFAFSLCFVDCLSVVCQLSVSCLLVVCQLSASCCQRRAVGDGRATASSKRQSASSRRQAAGVLRTQAPSGQRRLTNVWRPAANAQVSPLARTFASIPTPLMGRSGRLLCSFNPESQHGKPKQKIISGDI